MEQYDIYRKNTQEKICQIYADTETEAVVLAARKSILEIHDLEAKRTK